MSFSPEDYLLNFLIKASLPENAIKLAKVFSDPAKTYTASSAKAFIREKLVNRQRHLKKIKDVLSRNQVIHAIEAHDDRLRYTRLVLKKGVDHENLRHDIVWSFAFASREAVLRVASSLDEKKITDVKTAKATILSHAYNMQASEAHLKRIMQGLQP